MPIASQVMSLESAREAISRRENFANTRRTNVDFSAHHYVGLVLGHSTVRGETRRANRDNRAADGGCSRSHTMWWHRRTDSKDRSIDDLLATAPYCIVISQEAHRSPSYYQLTFFSGNCVARTR